MLVDRLRRAGEPTLRRVLHLYWRFSRGLTVGVRALVVGPEGEVLLVRHSYVPGWHLPGGGVEPGETLLDALTRELAEEADVSLLAAPKLHGVYFNDAASRRDHVALFVVREFRREVRPKRSREILDCRFFPAGGLPADATGGTRRRLAEILDGAATGERW
jgi:ADP-ribose pyrophosphatase YjhB (NUDIX family)